ncbi:MAG: hypothetical protein DCC67_16850 [Planctomycetota bacterium]|nr:MAG: hypothetical protein DCC67_16850 [Planctomycetota bacterium]
MRMRKFFELLEPRLPMHGDDVFEAGHEQIPNYVQAPDTVTVRDGNWFDPGTWSNGVPNEFSDVRVDHHVVIAPEPQRGDLTGDGHVNSEDYLLWLAGFGSSTPAQGDVNGDGAVDMFDLRIIVDAWLGPPTSAIASAEDVLVEGKLSFAADSATSLYVQTLTVRGSLEIGTAQRPIEASAEVVFRDAPIDVEFDPQQFGHGLLVIGTGSLSVNGRDNTPFARVAQASAGSLTLELAEPVEGWLPGDQLFLPDSRPQGSRDFSEAETVTIAGVNGAQVILAAPLRFSHEGDGVNLPHAAHLGGNIVFRSENPAGVRGHILVSDRSKVDVRDAVFADLGRTTFEQLDNTHLGPTGQILHVGDNQTGRYAFHIHHLYGPAQSEGPQFTFSGNVIRDGKKWGLAVHDSHFGLIEENVVVGMDGSGIVFEDGSEYGNTLRGNYIALVRGSGEGVQGRARGLEPRLAGDGSPHDPFRTEGDHGHEGAGIWARGMSNHIIDNVIANATFGSVLWSRFQGSERLPLFPGADTREDFFLEKPGQQLGHDFAGNEFYALPLAAAWQGLSQETPGGRFVTRDMRAWNVRDVLRTSYSQVIRFEGGDFRGTGLFIHPGHNKSFEIDGGARVIGFEVGFHTHNVGYVGDAYFDCTKVDIAIEYERTEAFQRQIVINGARFSDDHNNIVYRMNDYFNVRSYTAPLDVLVYNYNGVAGDDFQVWMNDQRADYVMPTGNETVQRGERISPEAGLANEALWEKYRMTLAGKLLPKEARQRQGINGWVTPIPNDLQGPLVTDVTVTVTGTTATIRWTTDEPSYSLVEYDGEEITLEAYTNLLPAAASLKTEHETTIAGLKPDTDYYFLIRVVDELGNLGGDLSLSGLTYRARRFRTAIE